MYTHRHIYTHTSTKIHAHPHPHTWGWCEIPSGTHAAAAAAAVVAVGMPKSIGRPLYACGQAEGGGVFGGLRLCPGLALGAPQGRGVFL